MGNWITYPRILSLLALHGVGNFTILVLYPQEKNPVHLIRKSLGEPRRRYETGVKGLSPCLCVESNPGHLTHSQSLSV